MRYTIRPFVAVPPEFGQGRRKPNPFRSTYTQTLKLLDVELTHLKAANVVFELVVREGDVRLDGMLYANAKVSHPGVRLSFDSAHGPLTYATDRHEGQWSNDPPGWQINLRAIALGLESLRAVDRYGITEAHQQYTGFKQLGAGTAMGAPTSSHLTATDAQKRVMELAYWDAVWPANDDGLARLVRRAKFEAHPDRNDGGNTKWTYLAEALQVLRLDR